MRNPNATMNLTRAGMGRKPGAVNKTTRQAKDAIQYAFDALGGAEALAAWAADPKNTGVFYASIYPKILPVQLRGDSEPGSAPLRIAFVEAKKVD